MAIKLGNPIGQTFIDSTSRGSWLKLGFNSFNNSISNPAALHERIVAILNAQKTSPLHPNRGFHDEIGLRECWIDRDSRSTPLVQAPSRIKAASFMPLRISQLPKPKDPKSDLTTLDSTTPSAFHISHLNRQYVYLRRRYFFRTAWKHWCSSSLGYVLSTQTGLKHLLIRLHKA